MEKTHTLEYCPTCKATTSQRIERGVGGITRHVCTVCGLPREAWRVVGSSETSREI